MKPSHTPRRIVVTGASRGLGLEFTRLWLEAGHHVFALSRTPEDSPELGRLAKQYKGASSLGACDVGDDGAVVAAARAVGQAWDRVDLLLNNAGTYGPGDDTLEGLRLDEVRRVFETNALGPIRMTRALLPLLRRSFGPKVVHLTSLMGSISDNRSGGSWAYRLSKAALNMASRNMAHDLRADGIVCAVVHPGWVQTRMGGPRAPLTVEESVGAMIRTIDTLGPDQSGGFFDRDGNELPW